MKFIMAYCEFVTLLNAVNTEHSKPRCDECLPISVLNAQRIIYIHLTASIRWKLKFFIIITSRGRCQFASNDTSETLAHRWYLIAAKEKRKNIISKMVNLYKMAKQNKETSNNVPVFLYYLSVYVRPFRMESLQKNVSFNIRLARKQRYKRIWTGTRQSHTHMHTNEMANL